MVYWWHFGKDVEYYFFGVQSTLRAQWGAKGAGNAIDCQEKRTFMIFELPGSRGYFHKGVVPERKENSILGQYIFSAYPDSFYLSWPETLLVPLGISRSQ